MHYVSCMGPAIDMELGLGRVTMSIKPFTDYQGLPNQELYDDGGIAGGDDDPTTSPTKCEKYYGRIVDGIFYAACTLSGQIMMDFDPVNIGWKGKLCVFELPLVFVFFCFNIGVLIFNFYAIFGCPFHDCSYVAGPFQTKYVSLSTQPTPGETKQYIDMQKLVYTISTLSGSFSYLIMFWLLLTHYSPFHNTYSKMKSWLHHHLMKLSSKYDDEIHDNQRETDLKILNPFPFEGTRYFRKIFLHAPQMSCFYLIFFLIFFFSCQFIHTVQNSLFGRSSTRAYTKTSFQGCL